jgi:hypothetical protein
MAKKLSPFEEAFKEARAEGKKTFTFNGKSYGTVTADDEQKRIDKMPARVPDAPTGIQAGTRYVKRPNTPTPSNTKAQSLVDQGRGVQLYKDVDKEAVLNTGLGLASLYPAGAGVRAAYTAARPAIGAAAKYFSKKDSPAASVADDIKEPAFNPDKMVDRRSTTFPGRSEPKFNPEKMTGRDRPEPMKKGGKVSSASSRGDGIAQRGKTKGRMR